MRQCLWKGAIFLVVTLIHLHVFPPPARADQREAAGRQRSPGTLHILTSFPESMTKPFVDTFRHRNPAVDVVILNRKTSAALSYIRESAAPGADLFWASSLDAFAILKAEGRLLPFNAETATDGPARLQGQPLDDPDGLYRGFALYRDNWDGRWATTTVAGRRDGMTMVAPRSGAGKVICRRPPM